MSKKDKNIENVKKVKKTKKKMTSNDKRKLVMKIAGFLMAAIMIIGTLISIIAPLMYR